MRKVKFRFPHAETRSFDRILNIANKGAKLAGFRLLLLKSFWVKLAVILWWSVVLGSYIWFLIQLSKKGGWYEYFSIVGSFVVSGAGFNYITDLYKRDSATFSFKIVWPPLLISSGTALLVLSALCGAGRHWLAPSFSFVLGLVSVILIVGGSATGPKETP